MVLVTQSVDGLEQVHVVPMTTKPPRKGQPAVEVPQAVRRHLGLSAERSWILASEWNRFIWPGYDIRPIRGREPEVSYGFVPSSLFEQLRKEILAAAIGRPVDRDD